MKKILILAVLAALISACGGRGNSNKDQIEGQIIITIYGESTSFALEGTGTVTIDWGNEIEIAEIWGLEEDGGGPLFFIDNRKFSNKGTHAITITGANIIGLYSPSANITALDISKNPALITLHAQSNELSDLDVSKNPALKELWLSNNQFSATALNKLFAKLHNNGGKIWVEKNLGSIDCDPSIGEAKGWSVIVAFFAIDFMTPNDERVRSIRGDLNGDEQNDEILITRQTIERDARNNKRGLIVALKRGEGYELAFAVPDCFACENCFNPSYDFFVDIKAGNLFIQTSVGGDNGGSHNFTFRYQNKNFELIGYERYTREIWFDESIDMYQIVEITRSYNFLTKKMIYHITSTDQTGIVRTDEEKIHDFTFKNLLKLTDFKKIGRAHV